MFIGLLSFNGFLVTECMLLNNEQCKTSPALINLNPAEINYYPYFDIWQNLCPKQNRRCKFK